MHIATRFLPALGLCFVPVAPEPAAAQAALPEAVHPVPVQDVVPPRVQSQSQSASQFGEAGQTRSAGGEASAWIEASIPTAPAWQAEPQFDVATRRRIEAEAEAHPLHVAPEPKPQREPDAPATSPASATPAPPKPADVAVLRERPSEPHSARPIERAMAPHEDLLRRYRETTEAMEIELSRLIDDLAKQEPIQAGMIELARKMAAYHSHLGHRPEGTRLKELRQSIHKPMG